MLSGAACLKAYHELSCSTNGRGRVSMGSEENLGLSASLVRRIGDNADATQISDALAAIWQEIEAVLAPILGQRGVAALYKRSLYLASPAHPWLGSLQEGIPAAMDLAALRAAVSQQSRGEAVAGGITLLSGFHSLLTSLVGPSLTERLLRSVCVNSSSGAPAQDPSS